MAASEHDLGAALEQRFKGDRSGACIAAAVIEKRPHGPSLFLRQCEIRALDR